MDSEPGMRSIPGYKQLPHFGEMGSELGDNCFNDLILTITLEV